MFGLRAHETTNCGEPARGRLAAQRRISVKSFRRTLVAMAAATAAAAMIISDYVQSQTVSGEVPSPFDGMTRRQRLQHDGRIDPEQSPPTLAPLAPPREAHLIHAKDIGFDPTKRTAKMAEKLARGVGAAERIVVACTAELTGRLQALGPLRGVA